MHVTRLLATVFCLVILSGCAGHKVRTYGQIDLTERSITVPSGGSGLAGEIKQMLHAEGWRMSIDSGPVIAEGKLGDKTNIAVYDTFNTRYRLVLKSRWVDVNLLLEDIYSYDISIIDTETGSEVLTQSGRGAVSSILKRLKVALHNGMK